MLRVVSKKLEVTRRKVSRDWRTYRNVKKRVLKRRGLTVHEKKQVLASERDLTYQKISGKFKEYREYKHAIIYKSPYEDFKYTGQVKTWNKKYKRGTIQKYYKAKRNFDTDKLDTIVPNILADNKVKGVLLVFEVTSEETGQKQYVSNYITSDLLARIDESIFDYVVKRFRAGNTKDYKLRFIYLRIIYENTKTS